MAITPRVRNILSGLARVKVLARIDLPRARGSCLLASGPDLSPGRLGPCHRAATPVGRTRKLCFSSTPHQTRPEFGCRALVALSRPDFNRVANGALSVSAGNLSVRLSGPALLAGASTIGVAFGSLRGLSGGAPLDHVGCRMLGISSGNLAVRLHVRSKLRARGDGTFLNHLVRRGVRGLPVSCRRLPSVSVLEVVRRLLLGGLAAAPFFVRGSRRGLGVHYVNIGFPLDQLGGV